MSLDSPSTIMTDTSPDISALMHARLMARTGAERFLMGVRMHEAARRMVIASLPLELSEKTQKALLKARFHAAEQGVSRDEALSCGMEEKSK